MRRSSDFAFQLLRPGIKPTSLSKKSFANAPVHHSSPRSVSHHGGPSIPTVRATTPGEELEEQRRLKKLREQKSHPDTSLGDGQAPSTEKPTAGPRLQEARRFHLSKPTTLSSNARANATQFKSHLDLALFVERRSEPQAQDLGTFVPVETEGAKDQISQQNVVTPRKKRPKANAAEKAFIEDQRKIRTNVDSRHIEVSETSHAPASRDNVKLASAEPSARTQQILFDMVDESKGLSDMSDLKVVLDDSLMDVDSQDDYVYETYIRIPRSQLVNQNDPTNKDVTYGILVIEEEDQGLWEMYAEADEDPTWEEEDEDSNGKPFMKKGSKMHY